MLILFGVGAAGAEPVRGQSRDLGIMFELDGDSQWCGPNVRVLLSASSEQAYQPEGATFLTMVGRIRAVIDSQCRTVEHVVFDGYVDGRLVFAAETSRLTRWRRFLVLDPQTRMPVCPGPADPQCERRIGAYVTVRHAMRGEGFAEVELTSVLETGSDWHLAWQANTVVGGVRLIHRSELERELWTKAAFAQANLARIEQICAADNAKTFPRPVADQGSAIVSRSVICQAPGRPATLYVVLVGSEDEWLYLFSISGEGAQISAADALAARLAKAIAGNP